MALSRRVKVRCRTTIFTLMEVCINGDRALMRPLFMRPRSNQNDQLSHQLRFLLLNMILMTQMAFKPLGTSPLPLAALYIVNVEINGDRALMTVMFTSPRPKNKALLVLQKNVRLSSNFFSSRKKR